jgi:hypothetical protein
MTPFTHQPSHQSVKLVLSTRAALAEEDHAGLEVYEMMSVMSASLEDPSFLNVLLPVCQVDWILVGGSP